MTLNAGDVFGEYRIEGMIGSGGMGAVYRAWQDSLGRFVAIKTMHANLAVHPEAVQRFGHEGVALGKLNNTHIITIHGVMTLPDGTRCIAMEFLEGESLKQFVARMGGRISVELTVRFLVQVLDAIGAAHDQGIIHRDLKPENVFLTPHSGDPQFVKVLDFGVAKLRETADGTHTMSGLVLGTVKHMSPEQMRGMQIDPTTDFYAIGIMAYVLIAGRYPHQRDNETLEEFSKSVTLGEMTLRATGDTIPDLRTFAPDVPEAFARAVHTLLERRPIHRPKDALTAARLLTESLGPVGAKILTRYALRFADDDAVPPSASSYTLGEQLGEGGMAIVFRGTQSGAMGFSRQVAIKRVRRDYAHNPRFVQAFVEEARNLSQLKHSNIIQMFAFEQTTEGQLHLIMELIDGPDLETIWRMGRLPPEIAGLIVRYVARALGYAHDKHVLHRDVSLRNVLLAVDGHVYLGDFGLAREVRDSIDRLSATIRGTPKYLSPEAVQGVPVGPAADQWSLAVVFWECLTGESLFKGATIGETVGQVAAREIKRPSAIKGVGRIPSDIEKVLMRMLNRNPAERYASMDDVERALSECASIKRIAKPERAIAEFLASRFPRPAALPGNTTPPQTLPTAPETPDAKATTPLRAATPPAGTPLVPSGFAQSTLGSVASQSIPPNVTFPPRRSSRTVAAVIAGIAAACAAGGVTFFVAHHIGTRPDAATTPSAVASAPTTPPPSSPPPSSPSVTTPSATPPPSSPPPSATPPPSSPSTTAPSATPPPSSPPPSASPPPSSPSPHTPATTAPAASPVHPGHDHAASPHPATGTGTLIVTIAQGPWADCYVDGVHVSSTPCHAVLSTGVHHLRLVSSTKQEINKTVVITASKQTVIDESW